MKMFKRFAAALLAGVMVLAMLTACGGGAGGSSSNEIESKVLQYLNTVKGTSYSNNADLQSKVRAVLAEVDENGVISKDKFPSACVGGEGDDALYMQGVMDYTISNGKASLTMIIVNVNVSDIENMLQPVPKADLKDVKPLEVNDEFKAQLEDSLKDATPGTSSGKFSGLKAIGVATYTASNGKTYIGIAMEGEIAISDSNS